MSKDYWQTRKQIEQLDHGKTLTSKINAYTEMWEKKCYSDGIPDGEEVPDLLVKSHRVPTYKKIALAILKNDHQLKSLGFSPSESSLSSQLKDMKNDKDNGQLRLL